MQKGKKWEQHRTDKHTKKKKARAKRLRPVVSAHAGLLLISFLVCDTALIF